MGLDNINSEIKGYLEMAEKKLLMAKSSYSLSTNSYLRELSGLPHDLDFFDEAVQQAYYSVFYSTKAYLAPDGMKAFRQSDHMHTQGELEEKLIQNKVDSKRTERLMGIYAKEKRKRGRSTYETRYSTTQNEAKKSIRSAEIFLEEVIYLLKKDGFDWTE